MENIGYELTKYPSIGTLNEDMLIADIDFHGMDNTIFTRENQRKNNKKNNKEKASNLVILRNILKT